MSKIQVSSIVDTSGGNTVTINGMTPTADSLQGFRNRIINGDMRIDQRNAGASVTGVAGQYTFPVDRFKFYNVASSKLSGQRSTVAPNGFTNSILLTSLAATTPAAGDEYQLYHNIEGFNVADLGFGTASAQSVTLSFWVRSSLTGTFSGALNNNGGTRSYVFTYTIAAANTWEQKTISIAGDTAGTWSTDNQTGIQVLWDLGSGSNFEAAAGSWLSAFDCRTSGSVRLIGTNGATFYITGVQLEAGSVATPFERRPYGTELALCQRYFCKSFNTYTAPAKGLGTNYFAIVLNQTGSNAYSQGVTFPVSMRSVPSMTFYNSVSSGAADGTWQVYTAAGGSASVSVSFNSAYAGTQFFGATVVGSYVLAYGDWTASAEL